MLFQRFPRRALWRRVPGPEVSQAKSVGHDANTAQGHGSGREHRRKQHVQEWVQRAHCYRHQHDVVGKCPEQPGSNSGDRTTGEFHGRYDAAQVAAHQGDIGRRHGDIRSSPDSDAEISPGQRRRIVDPISNHGNDLAVCLETGNQVRLSGR